jgi:hypothetical protein
VTCLAEGHVPDDVYAAARAHFSEQELADLTLAVVAINGWNLPPGQGGVRGDLSNQLRMSRVLVMRTQVQPVSLHTRLSPVPGTAWL